MIYMSPSIEFAGALTGADQAFCGWIAIALVVAVVFLFVYIWDGAEEAHSVINPNICSESPIRPTPRIGGGLNGTT